MARICPYPGLRPFNEEESLYFKGRGKHIDRIKEILEEKKFLMVTGASGDGKSSLIFAGLLPIIKAGFLRAKFNR
ncbi:MAG: ATP-binding protein [Bacteroidia bacterium]|nr:ATP-binding protein [Bacteroidia bacterium]